MASVVLEARTLVESGSFSEIDKIYTNNLPEEYVKSGNTDETVVLIQYVNADLDSEGNNDFFAINREIELQIFYKLDLETDPSDFEIQLLKLFKKNHWSLTDNRGHTVDPDTQQLTATFYFTQFKLLDN